MEQAMANEGVKIRVDNDLGYGNYVDPHWSECFALYRKSKNFNILVEWHAVTTFWPMRQSVP